MKKLFATLATLAIIGWSSVIAQIPSITLCNQPIIGDTETIITVDTSQGNYLTPGAAGTNQIWTYSSLLKKDSAMNAYISPNSTPYFSTFSTANICTQSLPASASSYYTYVDNQTNASYLLGFESTSLKDTYATMWQNSYYPFTYLDSYPSNPVSVLQSGSSYFIHSTGYDTLTADAYGTLVLEGLTYSQALRINLHYTTIDSIFIGSAFSSTSLDKQIEYLWYDASYRDALFTIADDITNHSQTVQFHRNPKSVSEGCMTTGIEQVANSKEQVTIYPNPATNTITIENPKIVGSSSRQEAVIEISNMQGQVVKTLASTSSKTNIDVSTFPSGVYFVKVKTEIGIEVKKFIKE